jgi:hypothetical protein
MISATLRTNLIFRLLSESGPLASDHPSHAKHFPHLHPLSLLSTLRQSHLTRRTQHGQHTEDLSVAFELPKRRRSAVKGPLSRRPSSWRRITLDSPDSIIQLIPRASRTNPASIAHRAPLHDVARIKAPSRPASKSLPVAPMRSAQLSCRCSAATSTRTFLVSPWGTRKGTPS